MHSTGVRIVNEHFRGDQKIREASVEVWEYDPQGNAIVNQAPYQILPGDSFNTACYYRRENDGILV